MAKEYSGRYTKMMVIANLLSGVLLGLSITSVILGGSYLSLLMLGISMGIATASVTAIIEEIGRYHD